jgi:hypothetical protein
MHHRAKLTNDQVREIRRLYATGTLSYRNLARVFKCGEATVRDIVQYRTRAAA